MKNVTLLLVILVTGSSTFAQVKMKQANWQQTVNYSLNVTLDDINHTLKGDGSYDYTNNSPNALTEIYFHLWPNAYKDNYTAFAIQQVENGSTRFYYAADSSRGYIKDIDFKVNGEKVDWSYYNDQIDIAVLTLKKPVKTGETVTITTPFFVKIPGSFSRFGHEGQSYQMTQWYPKPAVYDVNGWNPMPYLDQGEFYSEFGRFEVKITIPKNYIVAATGELQEQSEHDFLLERTNSPVSRKAKIESSSEMKTITYVQDNIHDFAWFADKTFNVKQDEVILSNGQKVKTYVYASQKNLEYTKDIKTALNYYSDHCGYYPYSHCTVVKGALKAGGGMEYPMITVVANLGEQVIVHEVGHNWFYGILANNERVYPWMDESINSYFEYEATHEGEEVKEPTLEKNKLNPSGLNEKAMKIGYRQLESSEFHQAVGEHSAHLTNINYGLIVYGKGADAFGYLKEYLSQDGIDKCFKALFDEWKFKHPLPGDIRAVFERESGEDLGWFFDGLIGSEKHIDIAVASLVDNKLTVVNKGEVAAPFQIGYFKDGKLVEAEWHTGSLERLEIKLSEYEYDVIKLDPSELIPETNRQNNTIRKKGFLKKVEPLKVKIIPVLHDPNFTSFNVSPIVGYNIHNKGMVGLWINNVVTPKPHFNFSASPLYSFETQDLNGYFNTNYAVYRNKPLHDVTFGVKGSRFAFDDQLTRKDYTYNRLVPFVTFQFRDADKRVPKSSKLTLRAVLLSFDTRFDQEEEINSLALDTGFAIGRRTVIENNADRFFEIGFAHKNAKAINPSEWNILLQAGMPKNSVARFDSASNSVVRNSVGDNFVKLNVEYKKHINYNIRKKGLDIRVFGGAFLDSSENALYHYRMESGAGMWDYTFDQVLMGRGATSGTLSKQVIENDVFLKEPGTFGNMGSWTLGLNVKADLPLKLPLGVYFDAFTFRDIENYNQNDNNEKVFYSGGIEVRVIRDFFEIYVPMFRSSAIAGVQSNQKITDLGQRITFKLNFNVLQGKTMSDFFRMASGN